jgi:LacI family transcriptional regulator
MTTPRHIGLVLHHTLDFYREILRGITDYGRHKPEWIFVPVVPEPRSLRAQRGAGWAALISTPAAIRAVQSLRIPWVNVSSVLPTASGPRVMVDHRAVGRMAAQYFLDRGFRQFALAGYRDHLFSMQRHEGFRSAVEEAGKQVTSTYIEAVRHADPSGLQRPNAAMLKWLTQLPHPIAVFASNDVQGFQISEACREREIQVPEHLSLLSVDNDDLLCMLSRPPLSTVALPTRQIGYEAARILDLLLANRRPPEQIKLLPPVGIVERASSSVLAIDDTVVAQILRFIRENIHRPIGVDDVVDQSAISRRHIERRFRGALGRTIGEEIQRVRIETAQRLLAETDLSMAQIAESAGYSSGKHFATAFRREMQLTPSAYRDRFRRN